MDKTIQSKLIEKVKCVKQIFSLLFCLVLLSCSKSETEKKEINTNKTAVVKLSKKSLEKIDQNINNNKRNLKSYKIVDFTKTTNIIDKLKYEEKIAELRIKYKKTFKEKQKKDKANWEKEYKRLGELYYKYSNSWENIPDDQDKLWVVLHFIKHDEKRTRNIVKSLINSPNAKVSSGATIILSVTYEHENNYDKAMQIYNEGINHFLKGEKSENFINNLPDEEKIALGDIYHSEGVAFLSKKDYANLIESYKKSAQLYSAKPIVQASKYVQLAGAYAKVKDKDKVLKSLNKALECLPKQVNEKNIIQFMDVYELKKMIIEKYNYAKENKLPNMQCYH